MSRTGGIVICMMMLAACTSHTDRADKTEGDKKTGSANEILQLDARFVRMTKLNSHEYRMFLLDSSNVLDSFRTVLMLGEDEISLLAKKGNNISVWYHYFLNPVTEKREKIVTTMIPVYEFQTKR